MSYESDRDVMPGEKLTAQAWNEILAFMRRHDRPRIGPGIQGHYGEADAQSVDLPEIVLVRALADITSGETEPTTLNARVQTYAASTRTFIDTTEPLDILVRTYSDIDSGSLFCVSFNEQSGEWMPLTATSPASTGTTAVVRVPTDGSANMLTAAFVQTVGDGNPPMLSDGASCWAWEINGGIVTAGEYLALFLIVHSDTKTIYGVESGFTGTKMVCQDDGFLHTWTFLHGKLISGS